MRIPLQIESISYELLCFSSGAVSVQFRFVALIANLYLRGPTWDTGRLMTPGVMVDRAFRCGIFGNVTPMAFQDDGVTCVHDDGVHQVYPFEWRYIHWKAAIREALMEAGGELRLKFLRRAVLAAHSDAWVASTDPFDVDVAAARGHFKSSLAKMQHAGKVAKAGNVIMVQPEVIVSLPLDFEPRTMYKWRHSDWKRAIRQIVNEAGGSLPLCTLRVATLAKHVDDYPPFFNTTHVQQEAA